MDNTLGHSIVQARLGLCAAKLPGYTSDGASLEGHGAHLVNFVRTSIVARGLRRATICVSKRPRCTRCVSFVCHAMGLRLQFAKEDSDVLQRCLWRLRPCFCRFASDQIAQLRATRRHSGCLAVLVAKSTRTRACERRAVSSDEFVGHGLPRHCMGPIFVERLLWRRRLGDPFRRF